MAPFVKTYQEKVGLPPDALIHIGRENTAKSKITQINFSENSFEEKQLFSVDEFAAIAQKTNVTWINIDSVHEIEVIQKIEKKFGIHTLILADVMNTVLRPKTEDFGDYVFIVLKMVDFNPLKKEISTQQISLIVGSNFLISFQEKESKVFEPILTRIRNGIGKITKMGPDYLAYALIDTIVDNYFVVMEQLSELIEDIEQEVLTNPSQSNVETIHNLNRALISLRKSVLPLREVLGKLEKPETTIIQKSSRIYLKDVYEHCIQIIESIEIAREILNGMMDIYLSSTNNRLNNIMKILTIIATIFMPLTFIAGVYGMNFRNMPELTWQYGYPASLIFMATVFVCMLLFFKKKRWI